MWSGKKDPLAFLTETIRKIGCIDGWQGGQCSRAVEWLTRQLFDSVCFPLLPFHFPSNITSPHHQTLATHYLYSFTTPQEHTVLRARAHTHLCIKHSHKGKSGSSPLSLFKADPAGLDSCVPSLILAETQELASSWFSLSGRRDCLCKHVRVQQDCSNIHLLGRRLVLLLLAAVC